MLVPELKGTVKHPQFPVHRAGLHVFSADRECTALTCAVVSLAAFISPSSD